MKGVEENNDYQVPIRPNVGLHAQKNYGSLRRVIRDLGFKYKKF